MLYVICDTRIAMNDSRKAISWHCPTTTKQNKTKPNKKQLDYSKNHEPHNIIGAFYNNLNINLHTHAHSTVDIWYFKAKNV